MQIGDRIRVFNWMGGTEDFTVEHFRYCLGVFPSEQHRQAGKFTPLCDLYENGPDSVSDYIGNFGEYHTNQVQAWMDIPK